MSLIVLNVSEWVSSVLRPHQHSIGYTEDGFYGSKDPTNSRTPLIDQNMCVGTLAQDNLR